MTMQIAIAGKRKGFTLISDTQVLQREKVARRGKVVPYGSVQHSKVSVCEMHGIAVAVSGGSEPGHDPDRELADFISSQSHIPDDLGPLLEQWGDKYYESRCPGQVREFPLCVLLIVNPASEFTPLWKLRVLQHSTTDRSSGYILNGNDTNLAIFWPEYFKCDKEPYSLWVATAVGAFTVLMGSEIEPRYVRGLEIWQYNGKWHRLPTTKVNRFKERFQRFQKSIRSAVLR